MDASRYDTAEARRQAALLRAAAETIETLVDRLDRRVESMDFEGPAAVRFRAAMNERSHRARRAARDLEDLSTNLLASASR